MRVCIAFNGGETGIRTPSLYNIRVDPRHTPRRTLNGVSPDDRRCRPRAADRGHPMERVLRSVRVGIGRSFFARDAASFSRVAFRLARSNEHAPCFHPRHRCLESVSCPRAHELRSTIRLHHLGECTLRGPVARCFQAWPGDRRHHGSWLTVRAPPVLPSVGRRGSRSVDVERFPGSPGIFLDDALPLPVNRESVNATNAL
jgi:hypothetical protein